MPIYLAIFLGLVQGLTEFLPVSSSGHLMLAQHFFNMPENMLLFNIILHLATLCAVLIVFRKKIWYLIRHPFCKTNIALLITTAITCTLVLVFKDMIDRTFTYKILPFTFLATALILFATTFIKNPASKSKLSDNKSSDAKSLPPESGKSDEKRKQSLTHRLGRFGRIKANATQNEKTSSVGIRTSVITGLAQGIAVIPGLSRSGTTISAALACGEQRERSAEFSFLMSIPIIIASFLYELVSNKEPLKLEILPTALAFIAALISGILAIKLMLNIVRRIKLYWFSIYLTILSAILLFVL